MKNETSTGVKAVEIVVGTVMIAGFWLTVVALIRSFVNDMMLPLLIGFAGYVITCGLFANQTFKDFRDAITREK